MTWWSALAASIGGASVIVLAGGWIISRAIDHKLVTWQQRSLHQLATDQAKALEQFKHENQSAIEHAKTVEQRVLTQLNTALSIYSAAHNATGIKRVEAIDTLWLAVVELRRWPQGISLIDFVNEAEYHALPTTHAKHWEELKKSCHEYIETRHPPERVRPFVGEAVWQRYLAYWQFMMRVAVVTSGYVGGRHHPWYEDDLTLRLLSVILAKPEVDAITTSPLGRLRSATDRFDLAVLAEVERVLSGENASAQSIERVRVITREVAAVMAASEKP